jgi:PAS domain S-box-containing protein
MQERESDQLTSADEDSSCVDIQRMSLESAIRQAAEAIVITSATGKIQFVNPAFTIMTGYRPDEAIGQHPSILKSGVQDPAYYTDLWQTIRAGRVWRGELINRRKDGTIYTEEMSVTPVLTAGGRVSNYIAIKQDVTERKAAESARQFLAAIIESTEDAVVGSTLDGKILTWNRAAEKLCGYRADEAIGQPVLMLLAPEYHERTRRISEGLLRGRIYPQFESVAIRKNGDRVEVSISVCSVRSSVGETTGSAAIIRDITKAKLAEKLLRDDEARFRRAFEDAPFGLCMTTADSGILQVNATFCRMLGYSAAELTALGWSDVTHPDDRERSVQAYERLVQGEGPHVELEKRYVHKQGHTVFARVRMSVIEYDGSFQFVAHVEEIPHTPAT